VGLPTLTYWLTRSDHHTRTSHRLDEPIKEEEVMMNAISVVDGMVYTK
jgi:hypothetical protein